VVEKCVEGWGNVANGKRIGGADFLLLLFVG